MNDIGYLQTKIRENNEKILQGEKRIKKLELEIEEQERKFSQTISLMQNAMDITVYKNKIIKTVKESSQIAFNKLFNKNINKILKNIQDSIDSRITQDFSGIAKALESHKESLEDLETDFMIVAKRIFKDSNELINERKKFKRFERKYNKKNELILDK